MTTLIFGAGGTAPRLNDAKKLYSALSRFHTKLPEDATTEEKADRLDLFLQEFDGDLVGTQLLTQGSKVESTIAQFINLRLVKKGDNFLWSNRPDPPRITGGRRGR
jgi:hypothetical protein